jgi:glycosyltransferase involved in cell wall biosynthesis
MPVGSGAIVVHRAIEARTSGYSVLPYSPKLTYCPPALRWLVPSPDADIIHTTPDYALFFKRKNIPLVSTFHNFVIDKFMRPYNTVAQNLHYRTDLKYFLRRAIDVSDHLTAVSQFTADLAARELQCERKIEVIPNGVDTDHFKPGAFDDKRKILRVLFSGNPTRRKGAQWLPEIARGMGDSVEIVCASGLRGGWTRNLEAAGIAVLGKVPYASMPNLYRSVDVLIMPTVREGDSLVVLEAMSCGIPVVASDCSSLPERVEHGEGGYLCKIGDTDAFVAALNKLLDPVLRRRMGDFNRARAEEQFTHQRMIERYTNLFGQL